MFNSSVYANSAKSPSNVIIIKNPPSDLIISSDQVENYKYSKTLFGKYFIFNELPKIIKIKSELKSIEYEINMYEIGEQESNYARIWELDIYNKVFYKGQNNLYNIVFTLSNMIPTLIIEGCIFFLFNYRKKMSWKVFFIINIITQLFVNINLLNNLFSGSYYYTIIFIEICVFMIEIILLPSFIKEKKSYITILFAVIANIFSFMFGPIISNLII